MFLCILLENHTALSKIWASFLDRNFVFQNAERYSVDVSFSNVFNPSLSKGLATLYTLALLL